jgi:hypothetical protein
MGIYQGVLMEAKPTCLSLAACLLASCDQSQTTAKHDDASSNQPQVENRIDAPADTPTPAPGTSGPSTGQPADPAPPRPADTASEEAPSEPLTPEQMIAKYHSEGIAGLPRDVAETIIRNSTHAQTQEEQVRNT